jgi:hypothetical protein
VCNPGLKGENAVYYLLGLWQELWFWLLRDNASRATAILVFITGFYAFLTWRMTKAIVGQTRAMIQPVALLEFHWEEEEYYPASYFEIKNLGTQPLLLLDIKLWCGYGGTQQKISFTEHYTLWDEHILPPGKSLRPQFDFRRQIEKHKLPLSSLFLSYSLEVVASDLSKQIVLTYRNIPVLGIVNVDRGMPLSVRWRYFAMHCRRLLYRFKRYWSVRNSEITRRKESKTF